MTIFFLLKLSFLLLQEKRQAEEEKKQKAEEARKRKKEAEVCFAFIVNVAMCNENEESHVIYCFFSPLELDNCFTLQPNTQINFQVLQKEKMTRVVVLVKIIDNLSSFRSDGSGKKSGAPRPKSASCSANRRSSAGQRVDG